MVFLYGEGQFPAYRAALAKIGQPSRISQDLTAATACNGLLLPGGGDIFRELDPCEIAVIDYFVTRRRPILGICRGMQALNIYFGGTLYDCIPNHQAPHGDISHPTHAAGRIAALLGEFPTVNSNHHQAINDLGQGLTACQWAPDTVVEAIQQETLPILGVQWHPERWETGEAIFRWFGTELGR